MASTKYTWLDDSRYWNTSLSDDKDDLELLEEEAEHLRTTAATYEGSVIAGDTWGAPMEVLEVPEAREGSIEHQLHLESAANRYLLFHSEDIQKRYETSIRHRAIGVVYDPERERFGNYVPTKLSLRYDAFVFLDRTKALHPLHMKPHDEKIPETYPFGT
jgi:erythromycin esterase